MLVKVKNGLVFKWKCGSLINLPNPCKDSNAMFGSLKREESGSRGVESSGEDSIGK